MGQKLFVMVSNAKYDGKIFLMLRVPGALGSGNGKTPSMGVTCCLWFFRGWSFGLMSSCILKLVLYRAEEQSLERILYQEENETNIVDQKLVNVERFKGCMD